jgi:uncharacterized protein (TIGR03382 family)
MRVARTSAVPFLIAAACAGRGDFRLRGGFDDVRSREDAEAALSGGAAAPEYVSEKHKLLFALQRQARTRSGASEAAPPWRSIGPFVTHGTFVSAAGRLRAIVPHPTDSRILYIGTAGGGVWKTTDADPAGTSAWTWRPLTDDLPAATVSGNIAVGGLAMDAADPETLYLTLGDPFQAHGPIQFFVTHDGGATWSERKAPAVAAVFSSISPAARTVLVGGDSALWRSADGGDTFALVAGGVTWSIARFADGTLVCSVGSDSSTLDTKILFSIDGGETWLPARMPSMALGRTTIAASGANGWALASDTSDLLPGLLHTTDSGRNWSWVPGRSLGPGQGWYNQAIAIDPEDPSRLVVGAQGAFMTTDGSASWKPFASTHPDLHVAVWWTAAGNRLLLGHDGGLTVVSSVWDDLSRTSDNSQNAGVATQLAYTVSASGDRVATGLQDNGCLVGNATSATFDTIWIGDGYGVLVHPLHPERALCGVNGVIFRVGDGAGISSVPASDLPFLVPLFPDLADPGGNGVYTLSRSGIHYSADFGQSWTPLGTAGWSAGFVPIAFAQHGNMLLTADGATVFLSRDGAVTWKRLARPGPRAAICSAWIAGTTLYVASPQRDTSVHHLWKSTDLGTSWRPADAGLPPLPILKVQSDPAADWVLWAATDVGVYRSGDAGASWSRFGTGLPWVMVRDLSIAPDDSVLRAATYGRGIWEVAISRPTEPPPPASPEPGSGGCSSAPVGELGTLAVAAWAWLQRRRQHSR